MATRSTASIDDSSNESSQAHANQMIDMSGAVSRRSPKRSFSVAAVVRLARLCVLIFEPNPARHPVHRDLAGFYTLSDLAEGAFST